jgi:protein MpaA
MTLVFTLMFSGLKQKILPTLKNARSTLLKVPIKFWVIALVFVVIISYTLCFIIPKNINFTYAENSYCISKLTLLPDLYKQSGETDFKLQLSGTTRIGKFDLFSNEICFKPTKSPSGDNIRISYSPFGGPVFQSNYIVNVGPRPKASAIFIKPIALAKPVQFKLDQPDKIFTYQLKIDGKTGKCQNDLSAITCNIKTLNLKQGQKYSYKLVQAFDGTDASNATTGSLSLLSPTSVIKTSVNAGQIVYSKPKSFTIETDKKLLSASISLKKIENGKPVPIVTTTKTTGSTIEVSLQNDLDRESQYVLSLDSAEGEDGSLLGAPDTINFQTSGGPIVATTNIGASGVDANAKVVVAFDQAISQTQDISKLASFSGGNATISRTSNQIVFQLHSLPRCGAFTLNINKGIASQYDLVSKAGWSYTSRINCRATSVIGYSVNGRPITAYYYGSGPTTILFTGGIHGSEPSGKYIMQDWANYLDSNAYKIPAGRQVVIVPAVNPDGLAALARYNAHNVNIDRNFATANWQTDIDTSSGIVHGGGGTTPMSEPETRALASITTSLLPRLEVSFHAAGQLVGANQFGDSTAIGNLYASCVGYTSMIGHAEETMGYSMTGEYEDWAGEQYGTPAILIELPTNTGYYFSAHLDTLWKMVNI